MPHVSRAAHKSQCPLLITSRLRPGLHSLRHEREAECIRSALAGANRKAAGAAAAAAPSQSARFQVVHHSIQSNHLHLIVEAHDRATLTAGMRGLLVRIARALNRLWKRHGPVFVDRFHEHELRTPREVRNALVYVLQNLRKHRISLAGPDPYSSGPEFDGWARPEPGSGTGREGATSGPHRGPRLGQHRGQLESTVRSAANRFGGDVGTQVGSEGGSGGGLFGAPFLRAARAECPRARTWLLNVGWQRHGLIDIREAPCPSRGS